MKLIRNLEIMRDSFRIAHPMLIHQQHQNDEAIETVRAMEEALRSLYARCQAELADPEDVPEMHAANEALRRDGGEG